MFPLKRRSRISLQTYLERPILYTSQETSSWPLSRPIHFQDPFSKRETPPPPAPPCSKQSLWYGAAQEAINAIYELSDHPDRVSCEMIRKLHTSLCGLSGCVTLFQLDMPDCASVGTLDVLRSLSLKPLGVQICAQTAANRNPPPSYCALFAVFML